MILKKKVSLLTTSIACVLVFLSTYTFITMATHKERAPVSRDTSSSIDCPTGIDIVRVKHFEYVRPLLMASMTVESNKMKAIRSEVKAYVNEMKSSQKVEEISVYLRSLNTGEWFCDNPNQTFNPASMSKIIYVLTFLKEAEYNPAILNKKIYFAKHFSEGNQQNIRNFSLKEDKFYTVKELMTYMIQYSDNDATLLLTQNMNVGIYLQIFTDLELPTPPTNGGEYFITAVDFSKFFRVLYNASYLNSENSDFALKLLTESTFKDGICSGIDPAIKVSHKFGERVLSNKAQLHEFGIVYYNGSPYLLGVMTKGNSLKELGEIIAHVSRITFSEYKKIYHS